MEYYKKIQVNRQVTIPKPLRDKLNIKPGDKLRMTVLDNGAVKLEKVEAEELTQSGKIERPPL